MDYSVKTYLERLQERFKNASDFKTRTFTAFDDCEILLAFLGSMADKTQVIDEVLRSFLLWGNTKKRKTEENLPEFALKNVITAAEAEIVSDFDSITEVIMRGDCAIFFDNQKDAITFSVKGYLSRAITEPPNASTIRGPREGFTELLKTNLSLIRRRVSTNNLSIEQLSVGKLSKTNVALCYLDGIADKKVVEALKKRIQSISIDSVHDSSYIQKFLEKRPYSLFKQIGATEKSDIAVAKMMEGRVLIVVDNSPMVLTAPFLIFENFQDNEDYYARKHKSDYVRILRLLSVFCALALPALHVAVMQHQYHVIPLKFLVTLIEANTKIPITPVFEMLLVLFLFDMLHDASVRMPRSIGLALNVVGALVLGDTAVKAGIIGPPSVIVGAISGIGLFAVPEQGASFSMLRIIFVLATALAGLYGLLFAIMLLILYLSALDSYGTPYLAPFAPHIKSDLGNDGLLRGELTDIKKRPESIPNGGNRIRSAEVDYDK